MERHEIDVQVFEFTDGDVVHYEVRLPNDRIVTATFPVDVPCPT